MNGKMKFLIWRMLILTAVLLLSTSLAFAQSGPEGAQQHAPAMLTISYQGRVMVSGQPFDGVGYFKFAIVDSRGQYTWNSDGIVQTQSTGEPQNPLALPVEKGLFSVNLGATPDMTPIFPDAVVDPDAVLRVWFSPNGTTFTRLPDRPLSSAPWALVADTLDGFDSNDFALATHDHWGQTWSGSGPGLTLNSSDDIGLSAMAPNRGAMGEATNSNGVGVYGLASSTSGTATGVVGRSLSPDGTGVYGYASATANGDAWGVFGQSDSPTGRGVYGWAKSPTGANFGVLGQSGSEKGYAVFGDAYNTMGQNYGVYGKSRSGEGVGVYGTAPVTGTVGIATNTSGDTRGVYGESASPVGSGVYGKAKALSGANAGVVGESDSTDGTGVAGYADATSGNTYGVFGHAYSPQGVGVYGTGPGTAVSGFSTGTSGYVYGVRGRSASTQGAGVAGFNVATTGDAYGVFGRSDANAGIAVYGLANAGMGSTVGVYGKAPSLYGKGVQGEGGFVGVYGKGTDSSGTNYGVYGESTGPDGIGVKGVNHDGGYAAYFKGEEAGPGTPDAHIVVIANEGFDGGGPDGLAIWMPNEGGQPDGSVNFITFMSGMPQMYVGAIEGNGSGGVQYKSGGGDFAELLPTTQGLEPGDVVVIGPEGKLTRSSKANQTNVAGVYSTAPAFLGGMAPDAEAEDAASAGANGRSPIAIVGVVPVKVSAENGAIRPGDLLTASNTPGHAMKADPVDVGGVPIYRPGTIIGKALEPLDEGTGVIRVLITLH